MNDVVLKEGRSNGRKSGEAACQMMRKETGVGAVFFENCDVKLVGNGILGLVLGHFGNHDNRQQIAAEFWNKKMEAESWMIN